MPITANGFEAKKFQDVLVEINTELRNKLAPDITTSPETVLGMLQNIVAEIIADQEELAQGVADAFNVDKAEGKFLADLLGLVYMQRQEAAPSTGTATFSGVEGAVVPAGTIVRDQSNNSFSLDTPAIVSQESCNYIEVEQTSGFQIGDTISITIDNVVYSATQTSGDIENEAILTLFNVISNGADDVEVAFTDEFSLGISVAEGVDTISVDVGQNLSIIEVRSKVPVTATVPGPIRVPQGTVTTVDGDIAGIIGVTNEAPFIVGRLVETDEEFRARHQENPSSTGKGTLPAIKANLQNVAGVTSVSVVQNTSAEDDPATGLPASSFECIVVGGSDSEIANTIFNNKPISIRTFGNRQSIITFDGQDFAVRFSRPAPLELYFDIYYTAYDEEVLPANTAVAIREALVEYVSTLDPGVDFIPKRSYGTIYSKVPGIQDLTVNVAAFDSYSDYESSTPVDFSEDSIPIEGKSYGFTTSDRIKVTAQ